MRFEKGFVNRISSDDALRFIEKEHKGYKDQERTRREKDQVGSSVTEEGNEGPQVREQTINHGTLGSNS